MTVLRVTDLTSKEKEYYDIKDIPGETVRKEILIVQDYVIRHCEEKLTWEILAEVCELSPGYVQKLHRKWCRHRLHDFQNICRMRKAARYLTDTTVPVQKISCKVGIGNASYFDMLFRQTYGMTPTLYRQIHG